MISLIFAVSVLISAASASEDESFIRDWSLKDCPSITNSDYSPDRMAIAANIMIRLGEEGAYKYLKASAGAKQECEEQIILLTTLLYSIDSPKGVRAPMLGAPTCFPYRSRLKNKSFLNFPVVVSDGVVLKISHGYIIGGLPESALAYLEYSRKNGKFRKAAFTVPNKETAKQAAKKLFKSEEWNALDWNEGGGDPGALRSLCEQKVMAQVDRMRETETKKKK